MVIINNSPGVQMTVTKLTNNSALMTTELINGTNMVAEASNTDPFAHGGASFGLARSRRARIPTSVLHQGAVERAVNGLIEDLTLSFVFEARSPALFLFEHPDARVDAVINSVDEAGTIFADILSNGAPAVESTGGPRLLIKFP